MEIGDCIYRKCGFYKDFVINTRLYMMMGDARHFDIELPLVIEGLEILSRNLEFYKTDCVLAKIYVRYLIEKMNREIDEFLSGGMLDANVGAHKVLQGMLNIADTMISVDMGGRYGEKAQEKK